MRSAKSETIDMAKYANVKQVAKLCDCTTRHIQRLFRDYAAEGKVKSGEYDLTVFVPWYIRFLRESEQTKSKESAKERREEIKARTDEVDYLERVRELLPKKIIHETIITELKKISEYIYGISKRNSIRLLQAQTRTEIEGILNGQFDAAFQEYSDTIRPSKHRKNDSKRHSAGNTKRKSEASSAKNKRRAKAETKTSDK